MIHKKTSGMPEVFFRAMICLFSEGDAKADLQGMILDLVAERAFVAQLQVHVFLRLDLCSDADQGAVAVVLHTFDIVGSASRKVQVGIRFHAAIAMLPAKVGVQAAIGAESVFSANTQRRSEGVVIAAVSVQPGIISLFGETVRMDALPCQLGIWRDTGFFRQFETVAAFGEKLDHARIVFGGVLGLEVTDGNIPFGIDPVPAVARAAFEVDPACPGLSVSHQMDGVDVGC